MPILRSCLGVFFIFVLTGLAPWTDEFVFDEDSETLVSHIDIDKWYSNVEQLASFNRYYRNPSVIKARDFLMDEFESLGFDTHLEEFMIGHTKAYNVVAERKGTLRKDDIYIVGAHYDSISETPDSIAPGAEDNASGAAGLLALARSIKKDPEATIRFIAFSGEEAGLLGSKAYVQNLEASEEKGNVKGVFVMDMIGYTADDDLDIMIETSERNQDFVNLIMASHKRFCEGRVLSTFDYWGSDHVSFIEKSYNAALIIENDYGDYPFYHNSGDTVDNISKAMGKEILKMIAGVLGYWIY